MIITREASSIIGNDGEASNGLSSPMMIGLLDGTTAKGLIRTIGSWLNAWCVAFDHALRCKGLLRDGDHEDVLPNHACTKR